MNLMISKVVNGYTLTYEEEQADETFARKVIVVEDDPDGDDVKTAYKLVLEVLEHFGIYKGIRVILQDETATKELDDLLEGL